MHTASATLKIFTCILIALAGLLPGCSSEQDSDAVPETAVLTSQSPVTNGRSASNFITGADLSYINEVIDHGGMFQQDNVYDNPFTIFKENNTNLVRVRLWHTPTWTRDAYGPDATQMYCDLNDVKSTIRSARVRNMQVMLDFHYSDTWADPGHQTVPAAWKNITSLAVLEDSVYNYTYRTLEHLRLRNLMPEYIQLGNETNCGLVFTDVPAGFPACNVCDGNWQNAGRLFNAGIRAVRDVSRSSYVKSKVVLHVAGPENVQWWFDNIKTQAGITDFDVVGFTYYPLWSPGTALDDVSVLIASLKQRYTKDVLILETAYPWTTGIADNLNNNFGTQPPITDYPFTEQGQYDLLRKLRSEVIDGGGLGLVYWEPGFISAGVKTPWGTGSTWENVTLFDFKGQALKGMKYAKP